MRGAFTLPSLRVHHAPKRVTCRSPKRATGFQRHLPWGSAPFDVWIRAIVNTTAFHFRRHPLSGFLTPSVVSSRPGLVALFRATSAHGIRPSAPSPLGQPERVSAPVALMPLSFGGYPPEPRLQSLAPTERPFSRQSPLSDCRGRCTPDLFPLRGNPTQSLGVSPPPMHFVSATVRRASATFTSGPGTPGSLRPSLKTTTGAVSTSGVLHLPASNITRCKQLVTKPARCRTG